MRPPDSLSRGPAAAAAVVGGASWALLPLWDLMPINGLWQLLFFVLPLLLISFGLIGLHRLNMHRTGYGKPGHAGFLLSLSGLLLMAVGNAGEVVWIALRGDESGLAHLVFFLGFFLTVLPGAILLGFSVRRAQVLRHARVLGLLLIAAFPLAIVFAVAGGVLAAAQEDVGFWLGIATPYGIIWALLGWSMPTAATPQDA